MMIDLTESQLELLRQILDSELRESRYERADTDRSTYREMLKEREGELRSILDLVGGPLPDAS